MSGNANSGRPSKYTPALAAKICERLAAGETLRSVCRDEEMPAHPTVILWTQKNDDFSDQYVKARETGYAVMADHMLDIADDGDNDSYVDDEGNVRTNTDVIARSRLRVDTRKWLLSKALPKVYGDKLDIQHGGTDVLLEALAAAGERARNAPRS